MTETIVAAAVRYGDHIHSLPKPARHHTIMWDWLATHPDEFAGGDDQGFITSTGRYVLREEARLIAEKANQLLPTAYDLSELYSEDVW